MNQLKENNLKKCITFLREFIDGSSIKEDKKGIGILALDHLQKITAGQLPLDTPGCVGRPKADGTPYS